MGGVVMFPKRPQERLLPNPKLKLREQFHEVERFKHLSLRTEQTYWDWTRQFLVFHRGKLAAVTDSPLQRRGQTMRRRIAPPPRDRS